MSARTQDLLDHLKRSPIFRTLPLEVLEQLASDAEISSHRKGTTLYKRGEKADTLLVVLAGRLHVSNPVSRKKNMFLRTLGPGALVGWSLLAGEAHTANLVAAQKLVLARIPGRTIRRLFKKRPALPLLVIARMGALIGKLGDEKAELQYHNLDERVHRTLSRLSSPGHDLVITQEELAQAAGVTRAQVNGSLARLEAKGLLKRGRGWVRLLRG